MMGRETAMRAGLAGVAFASVLWAAVPMLRHMSGVIVLPAPPPVDIAVARDGAAPDLDALLELAPFGRAVTRDVGAAPDTDELPDIVLRGIFAAVHSPSSALLDVGGQPGIFREAMYVTDRWQVTRITQDLVALSDGASAITLRFDEESVEDPPVLDTQAEAAPSLLARLQGGFVVPARYEKPGRPETTAEYIDYWRTRVRKNPQAVLDEIGLVPTEQGYVIAEQHDVGVRLAGLRSGDLVRTVNGQPVGDPDADRRFYDEVAATGQARIEVERGGRTLSFSFPLR